MIKTESINIWVNYKKMFTFFSLSPLYSALSDDAGIVVMTVGTEGTIGNGVLRGAKAVASIDKSIQGANPKSRESIRCLYDDWTKRYEQRILKQLAKITTNKPDIRQPSSSAPTLPLSDAMIIQQGIIEMPLLLTLELVKGVKSGFLSRQESDHIKKSIQSFISVLVKAIGSKSYLLTARAAACLARLNNSPLGGSTLTKCFSPLTSAKDKTEYGPLQKVLGSLVKAHSSDSNIPATELLSTPELLEEVASRILGNKDRPVMVVAQQIIAADREAAAAAASAQQDIEGLAEAGFDFVNESGRETPLSESDWSEVDLPKTP